MKIQSVRGMNDVLPADSAAWQHVHAVAAQVFAAYGYGELRLPVVGPKGRPVRGAPWRDGLSTETYESFSRRFCEIVAMGVAIFGADLGAVCDQCDCRIDNERSCS